MIYKNGTHMLALTQAASMEDTWEGYQPFPPSPKAVLTFIHTGYLLIGVVT